jgi:hypothetical protein
MNKIPIGQALPVLSVVFLCLWFLILQLLPFMFFLRATHLVIQFFAVLHLG